MNQKKGLVYVWPLCTRIIHWMIALSFSISFLTSFYHHYFTWHIAFGYIFGIMLLFRLLWGFIGPDYGTFKMFTLRFSELRWYFREKIENRWRAIHAGHNAASSWFTLIVLFLGLLIVLSGLFLYGIQEGNGPLAFYNKEYFYLGFHIDLLHQTFTYILVIWVVIHIIGVLIEQFYHQTNMVFAMIHGYKKSKGDDTSPKVWHHALAYGSIIVSAFLFYYSVFDDDTFLTQSVFEKHIYEEENSAFALYCSKCHKNYPPFMLPKASWEKLMDGLSNHFGEEILEHNISKKEQLSIKEYLVSNSAEDSTHKIARKTLLSLGDIRPISATKSLYWRTTHQHIHQDVFKNPLIKDKSNCFACHQNFEYGLFDNKFIHLP